MKRPALTVARLRELLHYCPETGIFTWKGARGWPTKAGAMAGHKARTGYIHICVERRAFAAHRLAWFYAHGRWPRACIDHKNMDKADNRLTNLREATHSENKQNTLLSKRNTSGYKGVNWDKSYSRWRAQIRLNGTAHYIGRFSTPEEAYAAYCAAAQRLHKFNPASLDAKSPAPAQAAQAGG